MVTLLKGRGIMPDAIADTVQKLMHVDKVVTERDFDAIGSGDILISAMYRHILPESVLSRFDKCFNFHNAPLPDYKGYNAISHEMLDGRERHGMTCHWMQPEVDTGFYAFTDHVAIYDSDSAWSVYQRAIPAMENMAIRLCHSIYGDWTPREPIPDGGTFYDRSSLDDLKCLNGLTGEDLRLRIRALTFPGFSPPYFDIGGMRYEVRP